MALTQKTDRASSLYFAQGKNKNEINDLSVSVTPGSWLHITNFLATKESVQVSFLKAENLHSTK